MKIIAKVRSSLLAPFINNIASNAQSAFIKRRSIHDNFMCVRNFARRLHKCKTPSLLFKLDIRKAFDSVKWGYMLDLLQRLGLPDRFRAWIYALLSSSSSRILLNGIPGPPIKHGKGFRQGDPISPCFSSSRLTHCIRFWTWQLGKASCARSVGGAHG